LKFQISNLKKQANNNTRRKRLRCAWQKFKIPNRKNRFEPFGICDLFVIWRLGFVIL